MGKLNWYISRLKAMDFHELIWRLKQKKLQKQEYKSLYLLNLPVIEIPLDEKIAKYTFDSSKMKINKNCINYKVFTDLDLFAGAFDYSKCKKRWNAGFQTDNVWPEKEFSYSISCGSRVDIGDIRTNWELNRHYQFSGLAKNYYLTKDKKFLKELSDLFYDWNKHNLFLHGVEWNSPMEIAIRVNSWVFSLAFLNMVDEKEDGLRMLKCDLEHGILVMIEFINRHFSEYSSANNHLIVELYSVALVGIVFDNKQWVKYSIKRLTEELPKQNYEDGVNKEMSLHYQAFIMEAYGILMLLLNNNNITVPKNWYSYLSKMSEFVSDSCDESGEVIVFGDNDEGKILNLSGGYFNYYRYVLDLMSVVLEERYTNLNNVNENIGWLVNEELLNRNREKKLYTREFVKSYKQGGYTFIRDIKNKVFIGIDHADLGFGSIAAHGHADALSFQMYVEGRPVFIDSGTYNYHVTPEDRIDFRSTKSHNTVIINDTEQSEMLGPFLWGRRAKCNVLEYPRVEHKVLRAMHDGYNNIDCQRTFEYDEKKRCFTIEDYIKGAKKYEAHYIVPAHINFKLLTNNVALLYDEQSNIVLKFSTNMKINFEKKKISQIYNHCEDGTMIIVKQNEKLDRIKVKIEITN
ncbi:MAG: alginate lyase family protein [Blautia producta]